MPLRQRVRALLTTGPLRLPSIRRAGRFALARCEARAILRAKKCLTTGRIARRGRELRCDSSRVRIARAGHGARRGSIATNLGGRRAHGRTGFGLGRRIEDCVRASDERTRRADREKTQKNRDNEDGPSRRRTTRMTCSESAKRFHGRGGRYHRIVLVVIGSVAMRRRLPAENIIIGV